MTQNAAILDALKRGIKLTALDAMKAPYYCARLAARIADLKDAGNVIHDEWVTTSTGKRVKRYYMVPLGTQTNLFDQPQLRL